jgi:transcriptional regulator with XRE-family HTH domain
MTVEEYMKRERYTLKEMADKLGISVNYVFKIKKRYKNTVPGARLIKRIQDATGGKVSFKDFEKDIKDIKL